MKERDTTVSTKDETIDLLQTKLKETSVTLISNNSTIDSLKQSLAEAQKYSFRAILNNRQGVHHPGGAGLNHQSSQQQIPVGYQGTFSGNQQATLSGFLKTNDLREQRSRSNSPYRFNQCPMNASASNSKL